jgi:hypothetical protein
MIVGGWAMFAIPMASGERHKDDSEAGCDGRVYAAIPGRGD